MAIVSVIIAISALLFTIASFWWLQARRGRLTCFPVQTFSGYLQRDRAALRIPLSIFNSGAVPLVVTDLRLRLSLPNSDDLLMHFRTLRRSMRAESDDVEDFAHAYSVAGRSVDTRMVEFAVNSSPSPLLNGHAAVGVVEAQIGHAEEWVELGRFPIHVEAMAHPGNYITYSNQQHVWPEGLLAEAATAHGKLREQWGLEDPKSRQG